MTIIQYNNKFGQCHLTIWWVKATANGWRTLHNRPEIIPRTITFAHVHSCIYTYREDTRVSRTHRSTCTMNMHLHSHMFTWMRLRVRSNASRVDRSRVPARDPYRFCIEASLRRRKGSLLQKNNIVFPFRCFLLVTTIDRLEFSSCPLGTTSPGLLTGCMSKSWAVILYYTSRDEIMGQLFYISRDEIMRR